VAAATSAERFVPPTRPTTGPLIFVGAKSNPANAIKTGAVRDFLDNSVIFYQSCI
jgi:hypothetical protein